MKSNNFGVIHTRDFKRTLEKKEVGERNSEEQKKNRTKWARKKKEFRKRKERKKNFIRPHLATTMGGTCSCQVTTGNNDFGCEDSEKKKIEPFVQFSAKPPTNIDALSKSQHFYVQGSAFLEDHKENKPGTILFDAGGLNKFTRESETQSETVESIILCPLDKSDELQRLGDGEKQSILIVKSESFGRFVRLYPDDVYRFVDLYPIRALAKKK